MRKIKEYFSILEDTLIGHQIPAYKKVIKRRLIQAPRFYYFDVGITNYLLKRELLQRGSPEYGKAFEQFIMQEDKTRTSTIAVYNLKSELLSPIK